MPDITDLNNYRREREAETRAARVFVRHEIDPECVNRTWFVIGGETYDAVQAKILALMAEVESFGNGEAHFDGPHRFSGVYFATGHVVVRPDV
jgi:hypothetical protein